MFKRLVSLVVVLVMVTGFTGFKVQANSTTSPAITVDLNAGTSVKNFGATGNGMKDDTKAIQRALNSSSNVYIPDGTYMIDATVGLYPKSNQTITLSDNAVLKAIPNSSVYYKVIELENVSNVTIQGGKLVGDRNEHKGYDGEWGFGVLVNSNTQNITIKDMEARDFWGDGFYIGGDTNSIPTGIVLENVVADNNRRQGLSITQAKNVTVKNSEFVNTKGTAPEAGIDIEPNEEDLIENINIINVVCSNNNGGGIDLLGELGTIKDVTIKNSTLDHNYRGLYLDKASDIYVENTIITNSDYVGIDVVRDLVNAKFVETVVSENAEHGVSIITSSQVIGTKNIEFVDSTFSNNGQYGQGDKDGIRIGNYDMSKSIDNISFENSKFVDTQSKSTQRYGLTVSFDGGVGNVTLDNQSVFSGNNAGGHLGVN